MQLHSIKGLASYRQVLLIELDDDNNISNAVTGRKVSDTNSGTYEFEDTEGDTLIEDFDYYAECPKVVLPVKPLTLIEAIQCIIDGSAVLQTSYNNTTIRHSSIEDIPEMILSNDIKTILKLTGN